jgi:flagellar protein FliS
MPDPSGEYLRNAVMTATPEQLHLMLYDGAIRFARQAREAIVRRDWDTSCEKLLRAQRIVGEMEAGLRPEVNAELCDQMAALYQFVYRRLVDANIKRDTGLIDEALRVLEHQRETWRILVDKIRQAPSAADSPDIAPTGRARPTRTPPPRHAAAAPAVSTISIEG